MKDKIVKSSNRGLYIETEDFFSQPKVQEIVRKGVEFAKKNNLRDVRSIKKYRLEDN